MVLRDGVHERVIFTEREFDSELEADAPRDRVSAPVHEDVRDMERLGDGLPDRESVTRSVGEIGSERDDDVLFDGDPDGDGDGDGLCEELRVPESVDEGLVEGERVSDKEGLLVNE